jgi:hypothetical protein
MDTVNIPASTLLALVLAADRAVEYLTEELPRSASDAEQLESWANEASDIKDAQSEAQQLLRGA